jgi:ABC-2 type transport system permease protein
MMQVLLTATTKGGNVLVETGVWRSRWRWWWHVYTTLVFVRWANVRNEWYFLLLTPIFPLGILVFMRLTGAIPDPSSALYVTAGNAVLTVAVGPMQSIANDLAWGRQKNELEYFACLPIPKLLLVLGFCSVAVATSLPGMLLTLAVGKLWLGFPMVFHPVIILVLLVTSLSMVGFGVFLGVFARSGHHVNLLNNTALMAITFLSPLLIPEEQLPMVLRLTARLIPVTYAVDSFRSALQGTVDARMAINLAILGGFAGGFLYLAVHKLDWRAK